MDEGQIIGLVITIVAVAALLAGLVWLFATGTKPKWPEGAWRTETDLYDYHVVVVGAPSTPMRQTLGVRAARAAFALHKAWEKAPAIKPAKLKSFGVHVLMDDAFEKTVNWGEDPKVVRAYLANAQQRLGDPPPLIVMRASLVEHTIQTGQPVIHELIHGAGSGLMMDRSHATRSVWDMPGHPEDNVEAVAEGLFLLASLTDD